MMHLMSKPIFLIRFWGIFCLKFFTLKWYAIFYIKVLTLHKQLIKK